jgi:hypothetical protein
MVCTKINVLMDAICKEGKTFKDLHGRKVLCRHAGGFWGGMSCSGLAVGYHLAFICHSVPWQLLKVMEGRLCLGGTEPWEPWLWLSPSFPEQKLHLCPMTGTPGPAGLLGKAFRPKIPSVFCFPSQRKKVWCQRFSSMGNYDCKLNFWKLNPI